MRVSEIAAIAAVAAVIAYILSLIQSYFHHSSKAKSLGCKPCLDAGWEPTGIEAAVKGSRAQYAKEFPPWVQARFDKLEEKHGRVVGTITLNAPLFQKTFMTTDHQNIQAILALKFKEFAFGPNRTDNFEPLLGNGIVSPPSSVRLFA